MLPSRETLLQVLTLFSPTRVVRQRLTKRTRLPFIAENTWFERGQIIHGRAPYEGQLGVLNFAEILRYFNADTDPYLRLYHEAILATASDDNILKQLRVNTLYHLTKYVLGHRIAGAFAECGCWRGQSTYIISNLMQSLGDERPFLVFDSFEGGLPDKTEHDRVGLGDTDPEHTEKIKRHYYSSLERVSDSLKPFPFVKLYRGWIPDVFLGSDAQAHRFALVHIDVDLYEPTRDSLEFFFPLLVKGGIIVLDDYGASIFPGTTKAVDEFLSTHRVELFIPGQVQGAFLVV
jgi:O-methyltransferase